MRRRTARPRHLLVVVLLATACGEPASPRQTPVRRASDKAALYGDAALLPTRAGERARAEIALAEEVRVAVETLHDVERARVTVTSKSGDTPASAALVVRTRSDSVKTEVRAATTRIARATLGRDTELTVEVTAPQADVPVEDTPSPRRPLVLFAVLGLGISLGLTFDRTRKLLRSS